MVQVIQMGPSRSALQAQILGQSLGQGLGNFLGDYRANQALQGVINNPQLQNASPSERLEALTSALSRHGQRGQRLMQNMLASEQQRAQEKESEYIEQVRQGKELKPEQAKYLSPKSQFELQKIKQLKTMGANVYKSLKDAGYPPETASLWQQQVEGSTTGGLTDTIKEVNNLLRRSPKGRGKEPGIEEKNISKPTIEIPGVKGEELELDFPELPSPLDMTSSDIVKQNEYREKTNIPLYTETVDRLNALDDEYREIQHLQDLNEIPEALPTGIEKWNVDWDTGDLRFKGLASPEAQDYVKTIARMARRAKDFFPGRVTNFDLDQFKAGFPTLANSPEGRRIIAQQLALGNRIAYLKDETYKAAVDHYGSNADPVLLKKYATENYRKLKSKLENQLKNINSRSRELIENQDKVSERPSLEEIWK